MKLSATNATALNLILPIGAGAFVFYSIYSKKGDYKEAGIIALIVAAIGYAITSQVTKSIVAAGIDSLPSDKQATIATKYGASTSDIETARNRAKIIYGSFHDHFIQNEPQAIAQVNQCITITDVKVLCDVYQGTYGLSLRADFDDSVVYLAQPDINNLVTSNWY